MSLAVDEVFHTVRKKFLGIIGRKSLVTLEGEVGLSRQTLAKFLEGHEIRMDRLRMIEIWCAQHEESSHAPTHV